MDEQTELLKKILDTLVLIAEPQIAHRDEKRRSALISIVGRGQKTIKAASLMDGTKTQAIICKESGIDGGALSRLTKALRDADLIQADAKAPKINIPLSARFWEELGS
jgi:hypothetical protein